MKTIHFHEPVGNSAARIVKDGLTRRQEITLTDYELEQLRELLCTPAHAEALKELREARKEVEELKAIASVVDDIASENDILCSPAVIRAKALGRKLAKAEKERDEWKALAEKAEHERAQDIDEGMRLGCEKGLMRASLDKLYGRLGDAEDRINVLKDDADQETESTRFWKDEAKRAKHFWKDEAERAKEERDEAIAQRDWWRSKRVELEERYFRIVEDRDAWKQLYENVAKERDKLRDPVGYFVLGKVEEE